MGGFPPIDRLYYENPSLRVGGWMAYVLKHFEQGRPHLNIVPGETSYTRIPCQPFDSLSSLAQYLSESHQDSHYYRGQTKRYRVTYRGAISKLAEAFPELSPVAITIESLMPSLFRQAVGTDDPNWDGYVYPTPLDAISPAVRAIVKSRHDPLRTLLADLLKDLELAAVNNLLIRLGADPRGGLPDRVALTNVLPKLLTLISLSQHYEFSSCMIDITKDPEAAVWFASHTWSGEVLRGPNAYGVIYRFRKNNKEINRVLHKELMTETPAQLAIFGAGLFGLVDISDLPDRFGLRPRKQAGGSIMGLENSVVLHMLDWYDAYEVLTFPLGSVTGTETQLAKSDLCPPQDPATEVFRPELANQCSSILADELAHIAKRLGLSSHDCGVLRRARSMALI